MAKLPALVVDIQGLAKLVERRGKSFAILEVIQNAWDEEVSAVAVELEWLGHGRTRLVVEDDSPSGFRDLSHAFTMFADSYKKSDAEKRGRFNLGEKLVIALSDYVEIATTTGTVNIDVKRNVRNMYPSERTRGTMFTAELRMSRNEMDEAIRVFKTLIPPPGVKTYLNGDLLAARKPVFTFVETLATEVAGGDGYLRPSRRMTEVEIYEPLPGESAAIYEMGLPVVATGDRYHVNVLQKVPLNTDRDNVTPAYLRDIRTHVLNMMADRLSEDDASSNWVNDALEDDLVDASAVEAVMTKRFGEKRVIYDPSDPEANKIAVSQGYTLIPGRAHSRDAWRHVKEHGAVKPAGQVTPSPKPYSKDGDPLNIIDRDKWTDGMLRIEKFAKEIAAELLDHTVQVTFTSDVGWGFAATYGGGDLVFNKARLGNAWFENGISKDVIDLIIHEFGHEYESDHLSRNYYRALTDLGARMTMLALRRPGLFA